MLGMRDKTKRVFRLVAIGTFLIMIGCWILAVVRVNVAYCSYDNEYIDEGSVVSLGQYFIDTPSDRVEGYSLKIIDAFVMHEEDFPNLISSSDIFTGRLLDNRSEETPANVIVIELAIGNEGKRDDVGISPEQYSVIGENQSIVYEFDSELFDKVYPQLNGASDFSVQPGTETIVYLPFSLYELPGYLQSYDEGFRSRVEPGKYSLKIANYPKRVYMTFDATTA